MYSNFQIKIMVYADQLKKADKKQITFMNEEGKKQTLNFFDLEALAYEFSCEEFIDVIDFVNEDAHHVCTQEEFAHDAYDILMEAYGTDGQLWITYDAPEIEGSAHGKPFVIKTGQSIDIEHTGTCKCTYCEQKRQEMQDLKDTYRDLNEEGGMWI